MSRVKSFVSASLIGTTLMLGTIGGASAQLEPNPGNEQSVNSHNCIAMGSAFWTHNGQAVRNQDRQAEIKYHQATCNNANDK